MKDKSNSVKDSSATCRSYQPRLLADRVQSLLRLLMTFGRVIYDESHQYRLSVNLNVFEKLTAEARNQARNPRTQRTGARPSTPSTADALHSQRHSLPTALRWPNVECQPPLRGT